MWQDVLDGPEAEHDESDGFVGGVEAVNTVDDQVDPPIKALVVGLVHPKKQGS